MITHKCDTVLNRLSATATALVGLIALLSFILSYSHIVSIAYQYGETSAILASIYPLLIDLPIIVFGLATIVRRAKGLDATGVRLLNATYSMLTFGFNLLHASGDSFVGYVLASIAPMALFFSLEVLAYEIEQQFAPPKRERRVTGLFAKLVTALQLMAWQWLNHRLPIDETLVKHGYEPLITRQHQPMLPPVGRHYGVTPAADSPPEHVEGQLDVSESTIKRYRKRLNGQVKGGALR